MSCAGMMLEEDLAENGNDDGQHLVHLYIRQITATL